MKFVKVVDRNSNEPMFLNLNTVLAVRKHSNTNGTSILLSNGVWLECAETFQEFQAIVENRDPSVAKLLFNNREDKTS